VRSRASLLPWIVAFKAVKAAILSAAGVALLLSIHTDPVELVIRIAQILHLRLTSRIVERAIIVAFRATPRKEIVLALTAFGYAVLMGTEGVGLYLRRQWARWFTIIATSSLVPLELYEIIRRPRPLRVLILVINVAIVIYLVKRKEIFEEGER
jgi:uncharacterized membrane protein (DUF2068 family)